MNKQENLLPTVLSEQTPSSMQSYLHTQWQRVIRRRSFLKSMGIFTATVSAGPLLALDGREEHEKKQSSALPSGDVAILRFLAAAEILESDLWTQYAELGGVAATTSDEEFQGFSGGNPNYTKALSNLDADMSQYITDNTDDELSHAAFLNAYLMAHGAQPVDLSAFMTLNGSTATGSSNKKRLTNLQTLTVDNSFYTRYRSNKNPDLGATFTGPVTITNRPAIPATDADTTDTNHIQAIANTAAFHFAFIEVGGSSLYPTLALSVSNLEVLRILLSIGGVEIDHFALWHDKMGNAVSTPLAPLTDGNLTFPDLNAVSPSQLELTQTNKILPEPCQFIDPSLPNCSIIRPTSTPNSGAVAAVKALTADRLFVGQSQEFFANLASLAVAADAAKRQC
jgi:Ferritin-like domain